MVCTEIPNMPKWESDELRQLKKKLAAVNCRCPVCARAKKNVDLKIYDDAHMMAIQTEILNVADDSCQCSESINEVSLSQCSSASYGLDRFNGFVQPYPYPYFPCPSCLIMSRMLLSQNSNSKDEETEANIKANVKNKCNGAIINTTEDETVVSGRSSFVNDCKLLTKYESDVDADESDVNETSKGVNITSIDFDNISNEVDNKNNTIKTSASGITSNEVCADSTDFEGKSKAVGVGSLKKKKHSSIRIRNMNSDSTAFHNSGLKTADGQICTKKRVRISRNKGHCSDSSDFDPKYNSMDEKNLSKKRVSVKNKQGNISRANDDIFFKKKPVPDTKCANLETFLKQIRPPLPTFSELDLISSYSDASFAILT